MEYFSEEMVEKVWKKGEPVNRSVSPKERRDKFGSTILRIYYGYRMKHGWVIDHIIPLSQGGTHDLSNLQPLQWENAQRRRTGNESFDQFDNARR